MLLNGIITSHDSGCSGTWRCVQLLSGEPDRVANASAVAAAWYGDADVEAIAEVPVKPATAPDDTPASPAPVRRFTASSMLDAAPTECVCAFTTQSKLLMRSSKADGSQLACLNVEWKEKLRAQSAAWRQE